MRLRTATCLIAIAMTAASCVAARSVVPFVDAPLTPEDAAIRRVDRAAERAGEAVATVAELHLRARFNPAPCACPMWEVAVAGGWERVELRAGRDAEPGLAMVLHGTGIAESAQLVVQARRTDETVAGPDGRPYAVLDVDALLPDTPTP
jgi:hypothetical protein